MKNAPKIFDMALRKANSMSLINLSRYPISTPGPMRDTVLSAVQADLARDGCAVLKGLRDMPKSW